MILSHKHRINTLYKSACFGVTTGGCFRSFAKFCLHNITSLFQKLTPYPHAFFHLKSFPWNSPPIFKIRNDLAQKTSQTQVKSYIYCVNQSLREKHHKKMKTRI